MRAVVQRATRAEVRVEGAVIGSIGVGLVVLVGVGEESGEEGADWLARKLPELRLFRDESGRMNRSLRDVDGGVLLVSQFTLYGDVRKGRRPSFVGAAEPEKGRRLYERVAEGLRASGVRVETGQFGAMMEVELVNDGPVTLWLER